MQVSVKVQQEFSHQGMMPTDRAMSVLPGSRYDRKRGLFYFEGCPLSSQQLVRRANEVLKSRNQDLIVYPGV